jgi:hypothetical protein
MQKRKKNYYDLNLKPLKQLLEPQNSLVKRPLKLRKKQNWKRQTV